MASQPPQSASTKQPQSNVKELTIDDLAELENTLHRVAHKCIAFGLQLGVKSDRMEAIEAKHNDPYDRLREVLRYRLRQLPLLTWHAIVQALQSNAVQMNELAREVEFQHMHPATQPLSSSQPSSSQLMSVPVTSQAMPGPSPQLSQDVATPHPLQVGEQQALQGQPPLQRIPSHQPQTVAQSQGTGSRSLSSQPEPEGVATFLPIPPQAAHFPYHGLQATHSLQQVTSQPMTALTSRADQHYTHQHVQPEPVIPHFSIPQQPWVRGNTPTLYTYTIPQRLPQLYPQYLYGPSLNTTSLANFTPNSSPDKIKLHEFIGHIKATYHQVEVEKDRNVIKWPQTPSRVYINLVCVDRTTDISKQEADECTRAMVCDGSVDVVLKKKTPIDFSDIAKNVPTNKGRVILVEGAPGVGKSTFALEFCRRWERGEIAQQYQLVLLLKLRDKKVTEAVYLADLIRYALRDVCQAVERELVCAKGASTLIILEGFDELPSTCRTQTSVFLQLIRGELLPLATVLVTSRPWATQDLHKECEHRIFQHIEILGFTGEQIKEYVTSVFMDEGKPDNDKAKKSIKDMMSYIDKYPQIKSCMYIPLNAAIVVRVYQESKAGKCFLPKTLTELYTALLQALLLRYLYGHPEYRKRRWKIQSLKDDLPPDVYSKLLAISELAYSGICTMKGSVQLIFSNLPEGFETLGLMQSVPQLYVTQGEDMSHNFLHLILQEFLAALHISNMPPEQQRKHFHRQEEEEDEEDKKEEEGDEAKEDKEEEEGDEDEEKEGRWRVVLKFLAGLTKLESLSEEDLRRLLLKEPDDKYSYRYSITADVVLNSQQVNWMFETQRDDIVPLVLQEKTVVYIGYDLTPLDYYSLGYCMVRSHSHWVLSFTHFFEEVTGEEEVRMLVAGANTGHDTSAKVVGLRGDRVIGDRYSNYYPLSISAEALNVLFIEMKNVIHLQELLLKLPAECHSVPWPDLSGLRGLHLQIVIGDERNWRLDTLLPHLSLESLTIEANRCHDGTVVFEDCKAIGMLLSSSDCLKCLHFPYIRTVIDPQGMELMAKAMSENKVLPLQSLLLKCKCTFNDAAAHSLAVFIRNCTTLHHLSIDMCTLNAHGLLQLAQAIHHSSSLQERKLKDLTCTVDGDDEATDWAQLFVDYPHMIDCFNMGDGEFPFQLSHITTRGAQAIATILDHSSTLKRLDLSNNSIGDTGSAALAQALHHNSTLRRLDLSNSSISDAGLAALAQALHHNSILEWLDLSNNSIGGTGSAALAQALRHNSTLSRLNLSNNSIGDTGATALAQTLHYNSTLRVLYLSNNSIGGTGSTPLAQALHHNSTLMELHLSNNSIGDAESTTLAQALHHNSTLVKLCLCNVSIGDTGSAALAQALHHNASLMWLDLFGNDTIGEKGTCELVQALTVNTSIVSFVGGLLLPRRCEEYATQCPQYSEVKNRIQFVKTLELVVFE